MKLRMAGGSRRSSGGGTDGRSLEAALAASSLLLWLPYSLAAVYVAYCSAFVSELSLAGGVGAVSNSAGISAAPLATRDGAGYATSSASAGAWFGSSLASSMATATYSSAITGDVSARHHYSSVYYYIFPVGFEIAVFVPLLLRVVSFSAAAMLVTYYLSVHKVNGGEYLMAVAWALGVFSGYGWLYSSTGLVLPTSSSSLSSSTNTGTQTVPCAVRPSWLWLVVSLLTGLFSGILCKAKDIVDGKHACDMHLFPMLERYEEFFEDSKMRCSAGAGDDHRYDRGAGASSTAASVSPSSPLSGVLRYRRICMSTPHHLVGLGDRLYMVVPFCTGQWFSFILHHGWRGIIVENGTILLSLGLVGYTMVSYKFLKRQVLRVSGRVNLSATARSCNRRIKRRLQQPQQDSFTVISGEGAVEDANSADFLEDVGEVAVVDVMDLISKLFTTSFGVVVLVVLGLNLFMTSLCIPFLKALFKLNALVSGVGIVIELIMYEVA
ncbi:hypothetical protein, conserved [Leishmania tarentolae]|uniref:Uncharacterized protein n=1 Tax=Leishmania tarentolae TaxID=5689 RepID=A0A640K859_LEITA|nr:hypothetical protein, conserved [Leishmania tarentolae]